MTHERAAEILDPEHREHYESLEPVNEACRMGMEALKKRTPKKPLENEPMWAVCPDCGGSISKDNVQEHITDGDITFCEHCGQAIDWREEYGTI